MTRGQGGGNNRVLVAGAGAPGDAWILAEEVSERFGGPVDLDLFYQQDQRFQVSVR